MFFKLFYSIFEFLLLVYRNAVAILILILCPVACARYSYGSSAFLSMCISWDFLHIGSSVNKDSFISAFPIRMFLLRGGDEELIPQARISSIMLNRKGKSAHPALVPMCRENLHSFIIECYAHYKIM